MTPRPLAPLHVVAAFMWALTQGTVDEYRWRAVVIENAAFRKRRCWT